jgi:4-hydroxy-3-methylbut-2-enyl diphosphate reductase
LEYSIRMTIVRAEVLGMCMGVRRAETLARDAARRAKKTGRRVFTYGPLIHNPQAILELQKEGVTALEPEDFENGGHDGEIQGSIVVVRAHGAPPEALARLSRLGVEVVDATCPRVLKSQSKAKILSEEGWKVVIAGDKAHGEVAGILGHAPSAVVAENAEQAKAEALRLSGNKVALIAQTTMKESEFNAIAAEFRAICPHFLAISTLCPSTLDRQKALVRLAQTVDAIVVVGGKNSANTRRLAMAAAETGKPCWHVETEEELPGEIFSFERVGLTAGASTPDFIVDKVENFLLKGASNGYSA